MKLFRSFVLGFYTFVFLLIGVALILYGLSLRQAIDLSGVSGFLEGIPSLWIVLSVLGIFLIIVSIFVYNIISGKFQREKTIAFNNPDGQVTISLAAVEDFIKKIGAQVPEVKELRSDVVASRKGIDVTTRAVLWSDANIPDATEKIQGMIRTKIQEMLGIEEAITVRVHVSKIIQREAKEEVKEPIAPFRRI